MQISGRYIFNKIGKQIEYILAQEAYQYWNDNKSSLPKDTNGNFISTGHNDELDAFRHAYVSARVEQMLGSDAARYFGTKHEIDFPNPEDECNMDLWNNAVGRMYGNIYNNKIDLAQALLTDIEKSSLGLFHDLITDLSDDRVYSDDKFPTLLDKIGDRLLDISNLTDDLIDLLKKSIDNALEEISSEISDTISNFWSSFTDAVLTSLIEKPLKFDPLIIDLDNDGLELSNYSTSGINFDLDGDGYTEQTGWITGGDVFLCVDKNNNLKVA